MDSQSQATSHGEVKVRLVQNAYTTTTTTTNNNNNNKQLFGPDTTCAV